MPGSMMSSTTTSYAPKRAASSPAGPSATWSTTYPSALRPRPRAAAMPGSSSTRSSRTGSPCHEATPSGSGIAPFRLPRSGGDRQSVPGVDRHDEGQESADLVRAEVLRDRVVVGGGDVGLGDQRDRLGEGERRALASGEERRLLPDGHGGDPLLALARGASIVVMRVDAIG